MRFIADVHLHSRFARATSKALNPHNLYRWGLIKGLSVVGTGDFTHPVWFEELQEHLEPAEEGLFQLKETFRTSVDREIPAACQGEMRFLLSVEISLIYKKNDKTRKIHHVVLMPSFEAVARLNARLNAIGNLKSDGRPILGLDSRDLVEICLEACEDVLFIPAHIWTPHFAVLGASSGFDTLEECFEDMLPYIFAVETGLSSDPPMNWRLSMLDEYAIVSNSDAHSPQNLAREATCFDTELSYRGIYDALKDRDPKRFTGTLEFYPEEGKYHFDGHRKCEVCWKLSETLAHEGLCPICGKKLTVGVLHRVEKLADREEGGRPETIMPYESLIPLPEIIGSVLQVGPTSKKVAAVYEQMLAEFGPELCILRDLSIEEIAKTTDSLIAEGVRRMRSGEVDIAPGYDGLFGKIKVFTEEDRAFLSGQAALFEMPGVAQVETKVDEREATPEPEKGIDEIEQEADVEHRSALDPNQEVAVRATAGPVVVVAGPGTGKTRVLTHRVADLILNGGIAPRQILAVTFTNRAAGEMQERIRSLLPERMNLKGLTVGTFHRVALGLLRQYRPEEMKVVIDQVESRSILKEAIADFEGAMPVVKIAEEISRAKAAGFKPEDIGEDALRDLYIAYQGRLQEYGVGDFDDILLDFLDLLEQDAAVLADLRARFTYLLVDEFQDVNAVQYRLVKAIAGDGNGLFVIGDPDQAIYGFRGASPAYFQSLMDDFPAAHKVVLETTYRTTRQIIQAASEVIAKNEASKRRPFVAARGDGVLLRLLSTSGETAEGIAVVREISRMIGGVDMLQAHGEDEGTGNREVRGERSFNDFAVLFRTGRQAEALEACFQEEGLPYRVVGQKGFLGDAAVQQAVTFFRYVTAPDDTVRFLNALALPAFDPGRKALAEIRKRVLVGGVGPDEVGELSEALLLEGERYRALAVEHTPEALIKEWGEEVAENPDFEHLVRVSAGADSLEQLLDTILLGMEADYERASERKAPEAVTLMTLHASKGLEFPVVFICGVEDGLIPYQADDTDLAEERRLFYVGLTRAKDEAVLLSARSRRRFGERIQPDVSPFVADISKGLLEQERIETVKKGEPVEQLSLW